jgi:hypothetical protein
VRCAIVFVIAVGICIVDACTTVYGIAGIASIAHTTCKRDNSMSAHTMRCHIQHIHLLYYADRLVQ